MALLTGKSVDMVRKELHAGLLAYNLIWGYMVLAAQRANVCPLTSSFTRCWRRVRDVLLTLRPTYPAQHVAQVAQRLLDRLAQCKLPTAAGGGGGGATAAGAAAAMTSAIRSTNKENIQMQPRTESAQPTQPAQPTQTTAPTPSTRRRYDPPAIVYEAELEVRAGSPLGMPDLLDPFGLLDGTQ